MKRHLLILLFSLIFATTNASAGWLSKLLKGGALVGIGVVIGGAAAPSSSEAERLQGINSYVWKALERSEMDRPKLEQYIAELAESNIMHMTDTAAFGYALLGQSRKAVDLYEEKIVPHIPLIEDNDIQEEYERAFKVIRVCSPKNCIRMRSGELDLPIW